MSVAFISGAAKRMGKAIALDLANKGHDIILHYHQSEQEANALKSKIEAMGVKAYLFKMNLTNMAEIEQAVGAFCDKYQIIPDIVINNASRLEYDRFGAIDYKILEQHFAIHSFAPLLLAQGFFAPLLKAKEASMKKDRLIINMLDFKLINPATDYFSYTLSKYSLQSLTTLLAKELAPYKLRVCALSPGYMLPKSGQTEDEFHRLHTKTPLGIGVSTEDICAAIQFLILNKAITGQNITIDAGLHQTPLTKDISFGLSEKD